MVVLFFLLFLMFTFLVAGPILVAEFAIGRHTRHGAIQAFKRILPGSAWPIVGWTGVITCFVLLSFYSVVGGWVLAYAWYALTGSLGAETDFSAFFGQLIGDPAKVLGFQAIFMLITTWVVRSGISASIEKANKYMMPTLFIMLSVRSLSLDGSMEGVRFLLAPDWSYLNGETMLAALGQAFFALSLGVSAMITYASYLQNDNDLIRNANTIVWMNLLISLLAGLVIFPAVFALGFEPNQGPGLIFAVLPTVFAELPLGMPLFAVFMVLVLFATLTSAFAMLETTAAAVIGDRSDRRTGYTLAIGAGVFVVGIPSALSFGTLDEVKLIGGRSIFDSLDYLVSGWSMPLGALLIGLFVGWAWNRDAVRMEVMTGSTLPPRLFDTWLFLVRYIAPVAVLLVFLHGIDLLRAGS
ncbi:MAG: sodium-dependent transporter [Lautropia sp.]|nr:sodium-dependent transporter [Lautropia sp.]